MSLDFDPAAQGWKPMHDGPMPGGLGVPWAQRFPDGWRYALEMRDDHINPAGAIHGGILMAFADHVLGLYVWAEAKGAPNVTIQLNTHFLGAAKPGDFIILRGEVTRATGSMVFVRGLIAAGDRDVVALDGIWRVFRPR
jgi:acyl-coenzyme A thioesterase PaaI-like protein